MITGIEEVRADAEKPRAEMRRGKRRFVVSAPVAAAALIGASVTFTAFFVPRPQPQQAPTIIVNIPAQLESTVTQTPPGR